jgi:hypothetical protein
MDRKQAARFMREQQARERARKRRIVVSIVAAAVLLAAGLIGWGVYVNRYPSRYTTPTAASQQPGNDGLPIGTGPVESAGKHLVQLRLKRPGARWSEPGAHALLALRARAASTLPAAA